MPKVGWHCRERRPDESIRNPIQGEFFDTATAEAGFARSLVRESIQNSLDARVEGADVVRVRFSLSGSGGLSAERAARWFGDIWPHLRATGSGLREVPAQPEACAFLAIEDFGTRGLRGDYLKTDIPTEQEPKDFYAFFRAEGLSGKSGDAGGSWGVGKNVFPRSSQRNLFLALTSRHDDRETLLIGKAIVKCHEFNGTQYSADVHFGHLPERPGMPVMPCVDDGVIHEFRQDFRLVRGHSEPGLSVVVPYLDDESLTIESLALETAQEYFVPILAGRLEVDIAGPRSLISLNRGTIEQRLRDANAIGLLEILKLAQAAERLPASEWVIGDRPDQTRRPDWASPPFSDVGALTKAAAAFQRGEPVALRVPVHVRTIDGAINEARDFEVVLRQDLDGRGYKPIFLRGDIHVPIYSTRLHGHNVFALVRIRPGSLNELLRDAEPPAHDKWTHETGNFKDKYHHGRPIIDFVQRGPKQILEILTSLDHERDFITLADLLPEPADIEARRAPTSRGKRKGEDDEDPDPVPPTGLPSFRTEKISGGFVVRRGHPESPRPTRLVAKAAYTIGQGSSLGKYHPADFDFSSDHIQIATTQVRIVEVKLNRIEFEIEGDDFELAVSGFDQYRDLTVNVDHKNRRSGRGDAEATLESDSTTEDGE